MTTFQYENDTRLRELADQFFGKTGGIQKISGIDSVKVYMYLLAYCIAYSRSTNIEACDQLEKRAINIYKGVENRIFFEKAKMNVAIKDTIYFENYMKKMEEDPRFLSEWDKYFAEVA